MTLDFIVQVREPDSWPQDVRDALEERLNETSTYILAKDGITYAVRLEFEGDMWDAAIEYNGLTESDWQSYGPLHISDRPLINGMGDPNLARALQAIGQES